MQSILKALIATGLALGFALAAGGVTHSADELGGLEFDTVDADGDGQVVFSELVAVAPRASRETFDAFDSDGDEALDRTEYEAWVEDFTGRDPNEG